MFKFIPFVKFGRQKSLIVVWKLKSDALAISSAYER